MEWNRSRVRSNLYEWREVVREEKEGEDERVVMKGGLVKHVRIVVRGKIMSFSSLNCCSWPW
jgi:hypothetical protein